MASETSRYTWPIDLSFSANTPLCFIRRFNLIEVIVRVVPGHTCDPIVA
jgi:hypothetical protein